MFKFIHAADIHLDSPLRGLATHEGAPVDAIRGAARRALENLVQLALDEQAKFVLIAGDLYDGEWRDHGTGLFFVRQMGLLRAAEIAVYLIHGNHDAASKLTRHLRLPENVHVLSASQPETKHLEDLGVAIHGQSFATAAVTEDLSRSYPGPVPGMLNIGLLHTALDGREGHDSYAPCTIAGLQRHGYDYWALGHIHQREPLAQDPQIHFPGNLQGRHIRETEAKGALMVTVDDARAMDVDFRPLDVFRWAACRVDLGSAASWDDALDAARDALEDAITAADGLPLAVRFTATGRTPLHEKLLARRHQWGMDLRALALDLGAGQVWVEKTPLDTQAPREHAPALEGGPLAALEQVLQELAGDLQALPEMAEALGKLRDKLPPALRSTPEMEALFGAAYAPGLAAEVRALLADRLRTEAGNEN